MKEGVEMDEPNTADTGTCCIIWTSGGELCCHGKRNLHRACGVMLE